MSDDGRCNHHDPGERVCVTEIPVSFNPPPDREPAGLVHPDSRSVQRRAFAAELEHLPDIRDRLFTLADRAGYGTDVEVAIASITDAADEIVDAVEGEDHGALGD